MNLLGLVKSARGLDIPSLFKSLGVAVDIEELDREIWPEAFQQAARSTLKTGASVVRIKGVNADGSAMEALMVMVPSQIAEPVTKDSKKALDLASSSAIA